MPLIKPGRGALFPLLAVALAACAHLPMVGGKPLPPVSKEGPPMYRDLADIPDAPPISTPNSTDEAIKSLDQERMETEKAAGDLENQPFTAPAPAMPAPGL
jgi:hypothetical protein